MRCSVAGPRITGVLCPRERRAQSLPATFRVFTPESFGSTNSSAVLILEKVPSSPNHLFASGVPGRYSSRDFMSIPDSRATKGCSLSSAAHNFSLQLAETHTPSVRPGPSGPGLAAPFPHAEATRTLPPKHAVAASHAPPPPLHSRAASAAAPPLLHARR